ncbi:MAG: hypothetical protein ACYTG7_15775 [Planctomycetota bacterium]|jgi:hypothetical protein
MLDDLGIKGVRPIADNPSRNQNGKGRRYGQKFSIDGEEEEKSNDKKKNNPKKKKPEGPAGKGKKRGIDIVI